MASLENSWIFPLVESVHLVGVAVLVGTVLLVDLRLLGFGLTGQSAARVSLELGPWTRRGLLVVLGTGLLLFASNATRYLANPAFHVKLVLLLIALVFDFQVRDSYVRSSPPLSPGRSGLVALASMILWISVIAGGRAIADFDI